MTSTSTCSLDIVANAASPECAVTASNPARVSAIERARQIAGSSSTTNTRTRCSNTLSSDSLISLWSRVAELRRSGFSYGFDRDVSVRLDPTQVVGEQPDEQLR